VDGQIVAERAAPKLSGFSFREKGQAQHACDRRYQEILDNLQIER